MTVYTWWDVTKFEHLQMMEAEFEKANPDILLEFVTIPSKYADTMVTKLAGGEILDVMMLAMDQVPRYALNGMLLPLDDLASQEYKDALYPVVKDALTVNGTMYAAARDVTPKVMYLNTKMFEDAGIPIPEDSWTMDEFVEIAKQLTKGSGADAQWGYYWKNYTDQTFAMIAAFGGELYSEDGKASVLSTDANTMKGIQFMYDLYNTYKVCPTATQAAQYGDNEFAPFMADKVAMQVGEVSAEFIATRHLIETYGVRLLAEGRVLAYTGDSGNCPKLAVLAREADIFLCEATMTEKMRAEEGHHLCAATAGQLAAGEGVRKLLLTHYHGEDAKEVLREASQWFPGAELTKIGGKYEVK